MNMAKLKLPCNYTLNNFKVLCIGLTVFLSIALQTIFLVYAESKELNMKGTSVYYASSSNVQSDWGALTQDYMQKKSFSRSNKVPKKQRVRKSKSKYHFPEKKVVYRNEWDKRAAPTDANKTKQNKEKPKFYNLSTQGKGKTYTEPEDDVINISDNIRIKGRRETMAFTLNNSKYMHADQKVFLTKTEVYGAYAEVYSGDDFSFGLGPEYSHSVTVKSRGEGSSNDSDLSLGFQLMIGF